MCQNGGDFLSVEWRRDDGFVVSDDPDRIDLEMVHGFLTESYWASGIGRDTVARSIAHSMAFGIYETLPDSEERQVGFARIISDQATFAYLADVFVLDAYRGKGLAQFLMECIGAHPELQGLRQWLLFTRDAHRLYERFDFAVSDLQGRLMIRRPPIGYGPRRNETGQKT